MLIATCRKADKLRIILRATLIYALLNVFFMATVYSSTGEAKVILTPEETLWLSNNQSRIVLAVETGYAPFVFLDDQGHPAGLAQDYIRLIETKIGASFKQQQFSSLNEVFEKVRAGDIYIVNAVTKTPDRLKFLTFTDPFISVPNVILVNKDRTGQMSEKTLSGLKVSLVKSYAITENLINKNLGLFPDLVGDDFTALLNVSFGRTDAAIIDLATASYLISQKGITNLRVAGETELNVRLAIGTPLNEPLLNSILQKGLSAITDEERREIQNRWINISGQSIFSDWRLWLGVASLFIAIFTVIVVISIWNRMLRQQVMIRTTELEQERALLEKRILERTVELTRSEAQLRSTLENTPNVAVQWYDKDGRVTYWNKASEKLFGWKAEEALGKNLDSLFFTQAAGDEFKRILVQIRESGCSYGPFEVEMHTRGGDKGWMLSTVFTIPMEGVHIGFVRMDVDITLRKEAEKKIEHLAFYDPLTGLPNRQLLQDRLKQALASSHRTGRRGALMFVDMDNFKTLNDTLGHDIGDLLLQHVAHRLESCMREGDTVARLGGDEFVVMLEDLTEQTLEAAAQTEVIGHKMLAILNQPYQLATHQYRSTPSIGATLFLGHEQSSEELLKQADIAMYQAKASGRNTLRFFDPKMQASITARAALEDDLRLALDEDQFILYYQSQVSRNNQIIGAEVLLRWQHPLRGLVSPADFIPLAEESELILSIGSWVLSTACAQIKAWETNDHTQHLQLAVNVSSRQFYQAEFVEQVSQVLSKNAINPNRLKLELTESLVLDDIEATIFKMNALRKIGVRFSMDDFGTGYSSLSSLKKLPLDQLKIDQSFVRDIAIDPDDATIIETIIAMANKLNMEVIAEGVETEIQRAFLDQHDCHLFQGYLFSKPVPIEQFEVLLKKNIL